MVDATKNFGVLLPTRGVLVYTHGGPPRVEQNWQIAESAERMGYDSVWVGDSITSKPRLEPLTTMAALAARTSRVKIGTAVMLTALRHPVHLAHSIATIDNISNGRTVLGVGVGRGDHPMFVHEFNAVGVPIRERAPRLEEGLGLLRALWSQEEVTSEGGVLPPGRSGPGAQANTTHGPHLGVQQPGAAGASEGGGAGGCLDYQRAQSRYLPRMLGPGGGALPADWPRLRCHDPLPLHISQLEPA